MLRAAVAWLSRWLKGLFGARHDYVSVVMSAAPEDSGIDKGQLIVVSWEGHAKWALLKCPCGCGDTIRLSLAGERRPRWEVSIDEPDVPTVFPSVRQTAGCFSHFWLERGQVRWCRDSGAPMTG